MKAILRQVRISPKKSNLIAALVRNKKVQDAIDILKFTPKKAAPILKKLIESAAANAENNNKQKRENMFIKSIIVNEGTTYKRHVPISKGRAHPILKRTSHITVHLAVQSSEEKVEKQEKAQQKTKDDKQKTVAEDKTKAKSKNTPEKKPKAETKETKAKTKEKTESKKTTK